MKNSYKPEPEVKEVADFLGQVTADVALLLMRATQLGLPKTAKALANVNKTIGWEIADTHFKEQKK
jgi:hypothetical protein